MITTATVRLEQGNGDCEGLECRNHGRLLRVVVTLNGLEEATPWRCDSCWSSPVDPPNDTLIFQEPAPGRAAPSRLMQRVSKARETRLAGAIGGGRQKASGATKYAKGDVRRYGQWVGDDKTCRTVGYRLTVDFIQRVRSWCQNKEQFFISIGFLDPTTSRSLEEVVVMDRSVWEQRFFTTEQRERLFGSRKK